MSWTLICSAAGSCGVILALFLSSNNITKASDLFCISLNLIGGLLLTAGSLGNAIHSTEFIPFVVLNAVFALVAAAALIRRVQQVEKPRITNGEMSPLPAAAIKK